MPTYPPAAPLITAPPFPAPKPVSIAAETGNKANVETITNANKSKSKKHELIINFDGTKVVYTPKDFVNITHESFVFVITIRFYVYLTI